MIYLKVRYAFRSEPQVKEALNFKLKLRVTLAGSIVTMVTYLVITMTVTGLPMTGHLFQIPFHTVALTDTPSKKISSLTVSHPSTHPSEINF